MIKREEIDYQELFESSLCAFVCESPTGEIIQVNNGLLAYTGFRKEELIGKKSFWDLIVGGGKTYYETHYLPRLKLNGKVKEINFNILRYDGSFFPALINSVEAYDTKGEHVYTLSVIFDISYRKSYENELRVAKHNAEELTKELILGNQELLLNNEQIVKQGDALTKMLSNLNIKNNQLRDFSQILSHDLRAPVSNLKALLNLYDAANPEMREKLMGKFNEVVDKFSSIINELVEAMLEGEDDKTKTVKVNLLRMFKESQMLFEPTLKAISGVVNVDIDPDLNLVYSKAFITSIFNNLLSNSIRYRSEARRLEINVKARKEKDLIKIHFEDNGSGMDLETHPDKLFSLRQSFHNHPQSKGLGLVLIKRQIESLGGEIEVESAVNMGASFEITLNPIF